VLRLPAAEAHANVLYSAFRERPKHLDPARSYSSNEYEFIAQIYEPPFQYHYLKRPFTLEPLTAQASKTGAINAIQSSPIGTQSHRGIDRPADCRLASRRMATTANHRTAKSGECSRSQSKTMRLQSLVIVRGSNNQRLAEHMNV